MVFPSGWRTSQRTSGSWKYLHPKKCLMFPKDRNCKVCLRTKITRAPCRRRTGEPPPRAEKFGDLITNHHKVLNEGCETRSNRPYSVVVQDLATQWIQSYPCKTKTSHETQKSCRKFLEPSQKPKEICTEKSLELEKSCEDPSWNCRTSTLHRSETNGIAERAVRRVKEGTSAVLLQSGLDEKWRVASLECYCYLRNVQDHLAYGKTPYERRFGETCKGPIIPFGAMIEYFPISAKDKSRLHQFGKKVLPGIFLGYALVAWRGNLEGRFIGCRYRGAGEIGRVGNPRRLNAMETLFLKRVKNKYPIADGTAKLRGRDHEIRASTLRQYEPVGSVEDGSQPAETQDDAEARNDFWSIAGDLTSFIVIMLNLEFASMCRKTNHSEYH